MIVVVANRWDQVAQAFVSRWAAHNIRVLTSQDLSAVGWHQRLSSADQATAVVGKEVVPQKEIEAVVTRIPCVVAEELFDIVPGDRPYVATEMTAFLLFWLSSLKCLVVNRPTPTCLSGPYWRQENWARAAAAAGIPVEPVCRRSMFPSPGPQHVTSQTLTNVTVIGPRVFGDTDPVLHDQARRLADVAGVELLVVRFSNPERGARFVSADVYPDLSNDAIASAMLDCLQQGTQVHA
ncbi:MAG TPA: hypothetical protein VEG68_20190 [Terriglobales bacterium]|nr:hypothetical protein [Terriglobales bacterium]